MRRWTDFKPVKSDDARKDREENLTRFGAALEISMRNRCAQFEPRVKPVRIKRHPQLMFELTVPAESAEAAQVKVDYWIKRSLATTRTTRGGRKEQRQLTLPYGKVEVEPA